MAVVTVAGYAGETVRSDIRITVSDAAQTDVDLVSLVEGMYGASIRTLIEQKLEEYGAPTVHLKVEDSGALPFVIEARLEAALSQHLSKPLPALSHTASKQTLSTAWRTRLYVPGNTPKVMPNIGLYEADAVILDLEDSVAPSEKATARALVRRALITLDFGKSKKIVRINSGSHGQEDMRILSASLPDVFLLPKVENAAEVEAASKILDESGSDAKLMGIIESAEGVQNAPEVARASARLLALTLGIEDYLADIGATDKRAAEWANAAILNACRAAKIVPLGNVSSKVDDEPGVEHFAREMAALGFEGIGCIHPRQVAPAHRGFAPTLDQVAHAEQVIEQYEAALREGSGVLAVDGLMVDEPVYLRALRTLERAQR